MNLSRSFPSSLTYLKQKKAGQKNHFSKKQTIVCFFYFFSPLIPQHFDLTLFISS